MSELGTEGYQPPADEWVREPWPLDSYFGKNENVPTTLRERLAEVIELLNKDKDEGWADETADAIFQQINSAFEADESEREDWVNKLEGHLPHLDRMSSDVVSETNPHIDGPGEIVEILARLKTLVHEAVAELRA